MLLSRAKPAVPSKPPAPSSGSRKVLSLENFLKNRDFTGAIALLEFEKGSGKESELTDRWLGYCYFHLGDYKNAMHIYEALLRSKNPPEETPVNLGCCYFFLGMYHQAEKVIEKANPSALKTRLQFHLSHKLGDESRLMEFHQKLENVTEDMLSLAAVHYLRSHYQEAIDIYKAILLNNRLLSHECCDEIDFIERISCGTEYLALNVYIALCYYKLDYYDVSLEVLSVYLQKYPDSTIAVNLKSCNHYKLYNGKSAEAELKTLKEATTTSSNTFGQDLIRHNVAVFKGGHQALQVFPSLVDVIPEARLNLVIYHFKQAEYKEAFELIKDLDPSVPQEYILKGIVNLVMGQEYGMRENIKVAQRFFQLVGNSESECDTIPGRQCMASAFFLQRQFEEVLTYLQSIKTYFFNDDTFNFNYAQAETALGHFKEAEETLLNIQSEKIQNDFIYISHLARCFAMVGKPQQAWELYLKMESSAESFTLLQLLANDCYKMGHFYYAAKAFDLLERLDPTPEHWEGKRGACAGAFQLVVAGKLPPETLADVIQLLRNSTNPQVETIIRIMKRWAKDNRINI